MDLIEKKISNYQIIEKIGIGGMGVVYKAKDEKLERIVALKFLPTHMLTDEEAEQRFISEAKAASSFDHPNICTIYDINKTEDGQLFIVMAYYEGSTLKDELEKGKLPISVIVEYCIQIANGLARAHEAGITHRDIKPANIMITNRGEVKILDFGLAKTLNDPGVTKIGLTMGTAAYMSPEQAKGSEVNQQSDIWSIGVVMYQMLTGQVPFKGDYEQAIIYSILNEDPDPITNYAENCSSSLIRIVEKCLAKDQAVRYQNASELLNDLEMFQVDPDYGFNTTPIKISALPDKKNKAKKVFFIGGLIFSLIIGSIILPFGWEKVKEITGLNTVSNEQHLLILPLTNIGGDKNQQAFCDGLMETLSSKLTQIEKLKGTLWIVPSSEVLSNKINSPKEANQMFGVNLAVTGSLQFLNNLYRLNINLVDAVNLRQLNSSVIDIKESDIASLQDKSVIKLLEMLHIEMDESVSDLISSGGTSKPEAYAYYLQAKGYIQRYESIENIDEAINLFSLAVDSDSLYSLAYAGLGESYWRKYEITKNTNLVNLALKESKHAFKIDSLLIPVSVTLGMIYSGTGKYDEAIVEFRRALKIEPNHAQANRELAKTYELMGKENEAEKIFKRAIQIKPNYWAGYNDLGVHYYKNGNYDDAIEQFKMVIKLTPDNYRGYNNLGGIYYMLEKWGDARDMFEKSLEIKKSYNIYSNLGTLYFIERNYEDAALTYEEALKLNDKNYLTWGNLAAAYSEVPAKKSKAIETYNRAIKIAEEQIKINPKDPDLISNLASYYADIGDEDKSLNLLKKSLLIAPENVQVIFRAATIYEKLGNRDQSLYWIDEAIKNGYSQSDIENQPELKELIADARYQILVKKYNN